MPCAGVGVPQPPEGRVLVLGVMVPAPALYVMRGLPGPYIPPTLPTCTPLFSGTMAAAS